MKIKILESDKHGKFSFTKKELEELLEEAYDEGFSDALKDKTYSWIHTTPATITTSEKESEEPKKYHKNNIYC